MGITYADIKPLVNEEKISGSMLVCKFKDPESHSTILSSVSVQEFQGTRSKTISIAKHEIKNSIVRFASQQLTRFFGWNFGGSASRILEQTTTNYESQFFAREEIEKGVVKAFEAVSDQFEFVDGKWRLKRVRAATAF